MDKNYWESFYLKQNAELKPSLFSKYVVECQIKDHKSLIELGCGNGRDAIYFANAGLKVVAVDQCENEIKFLNYRYQQLANIEFECADFTSLVMNRKFDVVYSRFTLHSISADQQFGVLKWAYHVLNENGLLCIEARGQKNEIYMLGVPVEGEEDAFVLDNHYRRFINLESLCFQLVEIGFLIEYAEEKKGFAPFEGKDETYVRVIGKKY